MPVHDWTRVEAGMFHDFHNAWITELRNALNGGLLPRDYYALGEQHVGRFVTDVLTLHASRPNGGPPPLPPCDGGLAVAEAPPRVRWRETVEGDLADKGNDVAFNDAAVAREGLWRGVRLGVILEPVLEEVGNRHLWRRAKLAPIGFDEQFSQPLFRFSFCSADSVPLLTSFAGRRITIKLDDEGPRVFSALAQVSSRHLRFPPYHDVS